MQGQQSHIVVDVLINGFAASMIIDTGASNCVLDAERSERFRLIHDPSLERESAIGIGSGSLSISLSRCDRFELGDFKMDKFPFVLLDLSTVNETFGKAGCDPVDGIIGTDLLLAANSVIDYKSATILFLGNKRALEKIFRNIFIS